MTVAIVGNGLRPRRAAPWKGEVHSRHGEWIDGVLYGLIREDFDA